jgi:tetratricopeptide (TPR) repeat protein
MTSSAENYPLVFQSADRLVRNVIMVRLPLAISLLWFTSLVAFGVSPESSKLEAIYEKAFRAFDNGKYDEALTALDAIDSKQPNLAESINLRGVIYMRQGRYDKAEAALRKALSLEPKFWNARFNLAEIPFLKKDWSEARKRFEALIAGGHQGMQPETVQLIQYKILLTFLLQGKENAVASTLNKIEQAKKSPAQYFAKAAIAFQRGNQEEAREWMSSAEKRFSGPLNKLYSESFYELGWMQKQPGKGRAALEIASTTERADQIKSDAKANFERAERALQQRNFDEALSFLDRAQAAVPNDPAYENLRGEIYLAQKKYDEAEAHFQKAFAANPNFREAQYNLAQIPFKKGDYDQARNRFEALFAETPADAKNQAAELIRYKIFLTILLQGRDDQARQFMDQFQFTGDTPALYYAHAAWEFKHANSEQGKGWIRSAQKIYSLPLNIVFLDSFYDLGWLERELDGNLAGPSVLAQEQPSPEKPEMRLGPAEDIPSRSITESTDEASIPAEGPIPDESPIPGAMATAVSPSIAPAVSPTVSEASIPVAVASTSPTIASASVAPLTTASAAPVANASIAPAVASPAVPMAATSVTPPAAKSVAPAVASSTAPASSKPVVARSPTQEPTATQDRAFPPTFGELFARFSKPEILLIAGLIFGGLLLLVWLVVQPGRRTLAVAESFTPSTELSPSDEAEPGVMRNLVPTGSRNVPGNLKEAGPAVGGAVLSGAVPANGSAAVVAEAPRALPNEPIVQPSISSAPAPSKNTEPSIELPDESKKELPIPSIASVAAKAVEPIVAVTAPVPATPVDSAPEKAATEPPAPSPEEALPEKLEPAFAASALESLEAIEAASFERIISEPEEMQPMEETESAPMPEVAEEPVMQGPPIPELTAALPSEPLLLSLELVEPEEELRAAIGGHRPTYSLIETPSFFSKIISTDPIRLQPTTTVIMPETTITPMAAAYRAPSPIMSVQQPTGDMHTAVQLTFSLEVASMQLTPNFKMSGLQLRPTSKVVSMRLAPSQDPQPPMNLQVMFEVAKIELSNGSLGTIRVAPSAQQKPAVLGSPSFAISGLELVAGSGPAPLQLTPSHQEQASVHLTAEFQIAAVEFTPLFEISSIVLNSSSRKVSMQLPGTGPSSIEGAPVFEIENVQLGPGNELGLIEVTSGKARAA